MTPLHAIYIKEDGVPTWAAYHMPADEMDRLKSTILSHYKAEPPKMKYTIAELAAPQATSHPAFNIAHSPSWWNPKEVPDADLLSFTTPGSWTYWIFSKQTATVFYYHATW